MKIAPSDVRNDAEFLRRASLDLTGLPPTADAIHAFLKDTRDSRTKREELVDRLIGNREFVEYWTNKWADLLQVNRKFLDVEGAVAFRKWIRSEVEANVPYDEFVRKVLTASGSNRTNPAASYFKILRDPASTMENTTQLFLAIRFNCNKCHDHPFERWTQDQYYQTAAFFAQVDLKKDPAGGAKTIGGTSVEKPTPLYEEISDASKAEVIHDRTKEVTAPRFPFQASYKTPEKGTRRVALASWLTDKQNTYFARSYVNRLWGYMMGVGIIEPLDDIRAGNPASNPELLDYLTGEFIKSGFDSRHVMRMICKSRTYQPAVATNRWNEDDKINFSHATARRLPAEVLYDAVNRVTGAESKIPGVPAGTRAAELPDSGVELPSGFFSTFGRPARESACECERSSGLQLGPVMALISGPTIGDAIADPNNELSKLVSRETDDRKVVENLFVRVLNRPATSAEISACVENFAAVDSDHKRLAEALGRTELQNALDRPQKERERLSALATAQAALAAYENEQAPKLAEIKKTTQDERRLEAELKTYETTTLAEEDERLGEETEHGPAPGPARSQDDASQRRDPGQAARPVDFRLGEQPRYCDHHRGRDRPGGYHRIPPRRSRTSRLKAKGPGRSADGNFVLTEIEVAAAPKKDPNRRSRSCSRIPGGRLPPSRLRSQQSDRRQ